GMATPTILVSVEENLGDPIDIRMDIIHPEPVAAVAFPVAAVELTALRFRLDIAETENASLLASIKTTEAIERITRKRERQARVEIEQQLAVVQESSSKLTRDQTSNPTSSMNTTPKGRICKSSKQKVENSNLEEHLPPVVTMADNRTMAEMLRAPTEGCAEAIVVPPILTEQFKLKHNLINMMTSDQFFGLEKDNPHDHIRWFNKITSTIKYRDVPNSVIKLILFPFSLTGAALRWLEKEPPRSITTWDDLVSKIINEFFPPQELQISVMKSQIFNNGSMNLFMRLGIDIKISFLHALITVLLNCNNWILSTMP
nr:reverse transcriptase domain-containing protein [Tanacetum cinerariifolium]